MKAAAIFILLLCAVPASAQSWYSPQVGEIHPDIRLRRVDNGERVSLASFRGQKVLLVHFASW